MTSDDMSRVENFDCYALPSILGQLLLKFYKNDKFVYLQKKNKKLKVVGKNIKMGGKCVLKTNLAFF